MSRSKEIKNLAASLDMSTEEVSDFFDVLSQHIINPQTELFYINAYTLLIAVVLSAQATDKGVNKVTKTLFQKVSSPEEMIEFTQAQLESFINSIGLYKTKARNILLLSKMLIEKYASTVPETREELETLPGVGRKTANVILNTVFNQPTIAVDTHIFRVANRTGLACGKTPLEVERKLMTKIPAQHLYNAHHLLILHGRYTCKAQKPNCPECPVFSFCKWSGKMLTQL